MNNNSKSQSQTGSVFKSRWKDWTDNSRSFQNSLDEDKVFETSKGYSETLIRRSEGKIQTWMAAALGDHSRKSVLDVGCGAGNSFATLSALSPVYPQVVDYCGLDLFYPESAARQLIEIFTHIKPESELNIRLVQKSINDAIKEDLGDFDLVLAIGSLHHTDSVKQSLASSFSFVAEGGSLIGWVINTLKPMRNVTDSFFRDYFQNFDNMEDCRTELQELAKFFDLVGEALGERKVTFEHGVPCVGLDPGTYTLQQVIYDYFIRSDYRKEEPLDVVVSRLFDWFCPVNYHQTSRSDIISYIEDIDRVSSYEVISHHDGHFFNMKR